jgi:hypothetical protein
LTDTVLARIAALKEMPIPQLKQQWRDLFETEPSVQPALPGAPARLPHSGASHGGLKAETLKRLKALGEELDGR